MNGEMTEAEKAAYIRGYIDADNGEPPAVPLPEYDEEVTDEDEG